MITGDDLVRAVVQVGAEETPYLRCGRGGPPVVVLTDDASERLQLLQSYGARGCVIAPVPARGSEADAAALAHWLRDVLEGLGLESPMVIVSSRLAAVVPSLQPLYGAGVGVVVLPGPGALAG